MNENAALEYYIEICQCQEFGQENKISSEGISNYGSYTGWSKVDIFIALITCARKKGEEGWFVSD